MPWIKLLATSDFSSSYSGRVYHVQTHTPQMSPPHACPCTFLLTAPEPLLMLLNLLCPHIHAIQKCRGVNAFSNQGGCEAQDKSTFPHWEDNFDRNSICYQDRIKPPLLTAWLTKCTLKMGFSSFSSLSPNSFTSFPWDEFRKNLFASSLWLWLHFQGKPT